MKFFTVVLSLLIAIRSDAQDQLVFSKLFIEAHEQWIALPPDSSGNHSFGFVYIDTQAGLTLDFGGSFSILADGSFKKQPSEKLSIKYRIPHNARKVAIIPEHKLVDLGVTPIPGWLKIYQGEQPTANRFYRLGFIFNEWQQCEPALQFLLAAEKLDAKLPGLATEFAFTYNCMEKYDQAIPYIQQALRVDSKDAYTNKELIYALSQTGKLTEAEAAFNSAKAVVTDKTWFSEMAYNILHGYYDKKDRVNFDKWVAITKAQQPLDPMIAKNIALLENSFGQ